MGRFSRLRRDLPPAENPLLGDGSGRVDATVEFDLPDQPPPLATPPAKPVTATPPKPPATPPAKPVTATPAKTLATPPAKPVTATPAKPLATPPAKPLADGPPATKAPAGDPDLTPAKAAPRVTSSKPTADATPPKIPADAKPAKPLFDPSPAKPLHAAKADLAAKPTAEVPTASPAGDAFDLRSGRAMAAGYRDRARLRRRLRYLRRARELAFRDLGGFVFDAHRFNRRRDDIVEAKLKGLAGMDGELRALETALDDRRELMLLHEPGISVCPRCATLHASDANFCSGCGLPRGGAALPLGPRAPLPVPEPAAASQQSATISPPPAGPPASAAPPPSAATPGTDLPASSVTRT